MIDALNAPVFITKADGTQEPFDSAKLMQSLKRSGATGDQAEYVTAHIEQELRTGMTTEEIYRHAFETLKRMRSPAASRYSLKRALLDLGPTGYPFEDYVAEIFRAKGFRAETRSIIRGLCTTHEVDLVAEKQGRRIGAEVKFHNAAGFKSDIKTALYVKARFEDIQAAAEKGVSESFDEWYLITNTKFTAQAEEYAQCTGLSIISWDYPLHGNLQDLIEETRLHPVTCLTTLSGAQKRKLMENQVVLCKSLAKPDGALASLNLPESRARKVIAETKYLCDA